MSKEDKNNIEEEELNTQTEGQENETVSEENEVDQLKAELEDQKKKYLENENFLARSLKIGLRREQHFYRYNATEKNCYKRD